MATAYQPSDSGGFGVLDAPDKGGGRRRRRSKNSPAACCRRVSDLLRIFAALADGGGPVITSESVRLPSTDHLTVPRRAQTAPILCDGESWGTGHRNRHRAYATVDGAGPLGLERGDRYHGARGPGPGLDRAFCSTQRVMSGRQDGYDAFWAAVADAYPFRMSERAEIRRQPVLGLQADGDARRHVLGGRTRDRRRPVRASGSAWSSRRAGRRCSAQYAADRAVDGDVAHRGFEVFGHQREATRWLR